jgi:hypothetical protein
LSDLLPSCFISTCHFFSTAFFGLLCQRATSAEEGLAFGKGVCVFQKKFLFLPINTTKYVAQPKIFVNLVLIVFQHTLELADRVQSTTSSEKELERHSR